MTEEGIVILVTAKDQPEAAKIAQALLQEKLAACVNVLPGMESFFWWEGKLDRALETLLVIKSQRRLFDQIAQRVKALHSYQVPEVIAVPITQGDPQYLSWLAEAVKK